LDIFLETRKQDISGENYSAAHDSRDCWDVSSRCYYCCNIL